MRVGAERRERRRTMGKNRIAVGLDGSAAARRALRWAVLEAARRRARVLVVTAWPEGAYLAHDEAGHAELLAAHLRLTAMQREAVAASLAGVPPARRPVVGREIVLADPVTALARAGARADLLVLGDDAGHGLAETSVPGRIARRFEGRPGAGPCPLVVVPAPGAPEAAAAGDPVLAASSTDQGAP